MKDETKIIRLELSHINRAAKVCASAFHNDPQAVYLIPDATRRRRALLRLFRFALKYGILNGECYAASDDLKGIALWLPSDKANLNPYRLIRSGLLSLYNSIDVMVIARYIKCLYHSVSVRKDKAPSRHYYLFLLAVRPALQGKGYASALLKAMLKRLDGERLPCYLTTHNETNVHIYERHGFRLLTSHFIPRTNVKHLAMIREICQSYD